jgi:hypothetical protein
LEPLHKGSKPRAATPAAQAKVLRKTGQKPANGSTHWSCRKMAQATGLSKSTIQRIWSRNRVKPHRLERYMASDDPDFEKKAAEIIALTWSRRSMRLFSVSMKNRPFRRWIASTRFFR